MGRFREEAQHAAAATDAALAEELKELETKDLSSCFPNPVDKELMEKLAVEIARNTDKNEKLTACKAIALKMSAEGLKAFKEGFQIAKKLAL